MDWQKIYGAFPVNREHIWLNNCGITPAGFHFVVDGAQGVGLQPIDVKRAGIDFMSFSAWKWLMGPLGLGVFYISKEKMDDLEPVFTGTGSVVRDQEYLPYKSELKPTADRFTFSTPGIVDWVYFRAAIEFLDDIGFETVRSRIFELSAYLGSRLSYIGFEVISNCFPENPTGIIVCEKPGIPAGELLSLLEQEGIVAAERLDRIRFSPHIYNSPEQIDRVAAILEKA